MHKDGSWENWELVGGSSLLGLTISIDGEVLVCDAVKATDGSVYMSDASTKSIVLGWSCWKPGLMAASSSTTLLPTPPLCSTLISSLLMESLYLVTRTCKFRCLKHWLVGESKGHTEIFIDNLPGGPDNVNLAEDGSFWISLIEISSKGLDIVHKSKLAKKVVVTFPKLLQMLGRWKQRAAVVTVGVDGKIRRVLDDCEGKVMSFVTSAVEFGGSLYLGNLAHNFIGKLPLRGSLVLKQK